MAAARRTTFALGVMNIRPGTPADASSIAALIRSFRALFTTDPRGAGAGEFLESVSETAERQYLESSRYDYFIAERSGEVLGFVALRDKTHLFHLFVASKYQRQGIAGILWSHARERAIRDGNAVGFTVNSSLNAVGVYKTFGFVADGPVAKIHGVAFLPMRLSVQHDP